MLTFLKKHYEKLILAIFLIVFIVTLILQIRIITASLDVKTRDLHIEKKKADYHNLNPSEFEALEILPNTPKWLPSEPRNKMDRDYTDLCVAIEAARCPFCERIIPTSNFIIDHKCSWCGKPLEKIKEVVEPVGADADGDQIPNSVEIELGLDMNDPNDAHYDLDKDGFTNFYEFKKSGTKLNDAKSRPQLALRLRVLSIRRSKLPILVKSVKTAGSEDKSKWLIHVEDLKLRRTQFWALNKEVKIGSEHFKVMDIDYRATEKENRHTKIVEKIDQSIIILQKLDKNNQPTEAPPIKATVGRPVYEPTVYAYLGDVETKRVYKRLTLESVFPMGSDEVGFEKYQVLSIDPKRKTVNVKQVSLKGEPIGDVVTVTDKTKIPKIRKFKPKTQVDPMEMEMPDIDPELLRGGSRRRRNR